MATLYLRSVSDGLYEKLSKLADEERMSLNAYALKLIEYAIRDTEQRKKQERVLKRIASRRSKLPPQYASAAELVREVREERLRVLTGDNA